MFFDVHTTFFSTKHVIVDQSKTFIELRPKFVFSLRIIKTIVHIKYIRYHCRTKTDINKTNEMMKMLIVNAEAWLKSEYVPILPASHEIPVSPTHAACAIT